MFRSIRNFSSTAVAARDFAKASMIGRIGTTLEPSTSKAGRQYLRYPLAVETRRKRTGNDGQELPAETSWFNISVFDEKTIKYMTDYIGKGSTVLVETDLAIDTYEVNGETASSLTMVQRSINPLVIKNKEPETEA